MREPLIICGKPGSSKSLSVRLLLNAMKGEKSHINFFKQSEPRFFYYIIKKTITGAIVT